MLNASIVLYKTPKDQLENIVRILQESGVVDHIELIDNEKGPNLGYGAGHNVAIRKTIEQKVPYHLVVNADISFSPAILKEMVDYMEQNAEVGSMMPRVTYPNGELQYLCKQLPTPFDVFGRRFLPSAWIKQRNDRYELRATGYNKIMNIPYLSGCFMLLRTSALEDVGLFDERYFMYPEDIDLTRRIHAKYKTIFYPYCTIVHHHEKASYRNKKLLWIHITNMCKYFNKWGWLFDKERTRFNEEVRKAYLSNQ